MSEDLWWASPKKRKSFVKKMYFRKKNNYESYRKKRI